MKNLLFFATILLLISPLEVNANPFEKAFKELEKGLEDLADELDDNDKNKKVSKENTNLPESWKNENSNMATYKACQNNGGKPINNARGYYVGFFDPCLPAKYVMSPASIKECTNAKGEIKTAKSGTDPKNLCGQAYKVAQEKKAQKAKEDNQKLAANLDSRINSYRSEYESMVKARLVEFRSAAAKNNNIKHMARNDEWGDQIDFGYDQSQSGVRIFYDILVDNNNQCRGDIESILTSDSYDVYPWDKPTPGNPAFGIPPGTKEESLKKYLPKIKAIGNPNELSIYNSDISRMFIGSNSDNFLWVFPSENLPGIEIYLEFDKPLSIDPIYNSLTGAFKCYGTNYVVKSATKNKESEYLCFDGADARELMKNITLEGRALVGKGSSATTLQWAFNDFYSSKNTDGTQTLMFEMADGSKTRVQLNPFHPEIQKAYNAMCN